MIDRNSTALRGVALGLPEAWEDFPWGHSAFKVRKKVFLFMSAGQEGLNLSVKLTDSHFEAMLLPFTEPTGYGLGKSGWVSAAFGPGDKPPMAILAQWIEESYRAVALKSLVKQLDEGGARKPGPVKQPAARKKVGKKTAKKAGKKRSKKTKASQTTKAKKATRASRPDGPTPAKKVTRKTAKKSSRKTAKKASKKAASNSQQTSSKKAPRRRS